MERRLLDGFGFFRNRFAAARRSAGASGGRAGLAPGRGRSGPRRRRFLPRGRGLGDWRAADAFSRSIAAVTCAAVPDKTAESDAEAEELHRKRVRGN